MTVKTVATKLNLKILGECQGENKKIEGVYCCDLLSHAMAKLPYNFAWVTVMGNVNTLAVATLAEAACVVLAEDLKADKTFLQKANDKQIIVLQSRNPIFETARSIDQLING